MDYGLRTTDHGLRTWYKTRTVYKVMSTETESTKPCFFFIKTLEFLITQGCAEKCLAFFLVFGFLAFKATFQQTYIHANNFKSLTMIHYQKSLFQIKSLSHH